MAASSPNASTAKATLVMSIILGIILGASVAWTIYCMCLGETAMQAGWVVLLPAAFIGVPLGIAELVTSLILLTNKDKTKSETHIGIAGLLVIVIPIAALIVASMADFATG